MTEIVFFTWVGVGAAALLMLFCFVVLLFPLPLPNLDWLKGFLLAVLGISPLVVLLFGTGVSFETSKTVEFCSSCHVMESRVRDMKDPQSESLASLHYKNRYIREDQCFTCHTDYSLFGDEKAKMNGLRHVYANIFKEIKEPIELYKPYNTSNCLHCHGESKKFLEAPTHLAIMEDLRTGGTSCLDCHGPAHTPGTAEAAP